MKKNIKILSTNFDISLGNVSENLASIKDIIKKADKCGVNILSLPELCLTGASLYDLYKEDVLIERVKEAIIDLKAFSKDYDLLISLGAPLRENGKLYNTILFIKKGELITSFVKENLKAYEKNIFCSETPNYFSLGSSEVPVNMIYPAEISGIRIGVVIGEDERDAIATSLVFKEMGVDLILNPNAYEKTVQSNRQSLSDISYLSKGIVYVSSGAGRGESSTDSVYQGLNVIAYDGEIIESRVNDSVSFIKNFEIDENSPTAFKKFTDEKNKVAKFPYLPKEANKKEFVGDIMEIGSSALLSRMKKIGVEDVFLGVSGGLDSTMTLLFINEAYKKAGLPKDKIHAYTMPAFATSKRTKSNAFY